GRPGPACRQPSPGSPGGSDRRYAPCAAAGRPPLAPWAHLASRTRITVSLPIVRADQPRGYVMVCGVELRQSRKLADVCYDIGGPVLEEAKRLEDEGRRIIKLNIGNPAPFGFDAPEEILVDVVRNLPAAQGYSDSRGLLSARTAIAGHYQDQGIDSVGVDDVW